MLAEVKKLYRAPKLYDIVFVDLVASLSIFAIADIIVLQLGNMPVYLTGAFHFEMFFLPFATILLILLIFKPNIHLRNDKKVLLIFEIALSFVIIYVILW